MARAKAAPPPVTPERLREVLGSYRYNFASERDLQDGIAQALFQRGIRFDRGVQVAPKGAVADFLVEGTAVVVDLAGAGGELARAAAASSKVRALLLVVRRGRHEGLPSQLSKKPVHVLAVGEAP
jgi:hypothetical protein